MSGRPISRRSFLRGLGALAGWSVLRAATPAAAGLLTGPEGLRSYDLVSLARVRAGARGAAVLSESFDLAEHGRDGWYDVVLWPGDRRRLEAHGFEYRILIDDLVARDVEERAAELEAEREASPGQRFYYRFLFEYENDLRQLAADNPSLVRHLTLPFATHEGRTVKGVQIGANIEAAQTDGRPTSLIMGLHHAREWPSAELTIMLAQDLVDEYRKGTAEIVELLNAIRVFIIPVVNPDGFVRSRETISDFIAPLPGAAALVGEFAYHRKNMRKNNPGEIVELGQGVDPNRNYPYHWGGPGASNNPGSQTYYGTAPGGEPEIANVLSLLRANQVLTLITNHTYSNLVLRPWGDTLTATPDEAQQKALGDAMARINGYTSQKGIQLYATTGTTEDWLYGVCGGYGYTFEIGSAGALGLGNTHPLEGAGFHPQYNLWIQQFYNLNRGAFLLCLEAARNTAYHTVLTGSLPPGTRLTLRKTAVIDLGEAHDGSDTFTERLESSIVVGDGGSFTWHVNPSPVPATVEKVNKGQAPASALEPYAVEAVLPDGSLKTTGLVARRGQTYEPDFTT